MSRLTPQQKKLRIKRKIRATISGTATRPRLSVFRSSNYMYGQLIDDENGVTLISASDMKAKGTKMEGSIAAGKALAKAAKEKGITSAVFDRNGFKYAGRIKAFADAAREGGLEF
ncbi:MAG TPA: 50S ribosomal protein L18 [Candidatus Paceibacterota bacterium]|jgi:large subunit ribosomal protein L18|nr:50S ribosomal protein L18 [Candidatus Paceibacterota bacterium]